MKNTVLSTLIISLAAASIASAAPIKRELNHNRAALKALETKPFDSSAIESLADWSHPGALSESMMNNKVVVLTLISNSDPKSIMALLKVTRMEREFADQGIVVAAIHPDEGFEAINQKIIDGKVTIPVARDEGAVFASAMHADDLPEFYLIDRAGQLRYADIDQASLKDAVKQLASETKDTALANAKLQAQGIAPKATAKAGEKNIAPALYKRAQWPAHNTNPLSAEKDVQGKPLPVPMGKEVWVDNKRSLDDKVLVLDFWATWCGPCIAAAPMLEKMQDTYEGKLEVVGIGGAEKYATFKNYVLKKQGNYAQMFDPNQTIDNAIGIKGIPHVLVLSTDGIVRWQGNPHNPAFAEAVDMTVENDPMFASNN